MAQKLTFGITRNLSWLPILAKEKNMFKAQGLDIEFRNLPTGKKGLDYLQKNWVDMASVIDGNIATLPALKKPKIKLLSTIQVKADAGIIAHGAHIKSPRDLYGKRVGYLPRTSSHMFLIRFCEHHELNIEQLNLVPIDLNTFKDKFLRGGLDAISLWEPYRVQSRICAAQLDIPVIEFQNEGFYKFYAVLAVSQKAVKLKGYEIEQVLTVLREVEQYALNNPQEILDILSREYELKPEIFNTLLHNTQLSVQPVLQDFWKEVRTLREFIDPKENLDYEKFIELLTKID